MDALDAANAALEQTQRPGGPGFRLGPPTSGHFCANCNAPSMVAADVLRIDDNGSTPIAVFYACENNCGPAGLTGSEGE